MVEGRSAETEGSRPFRLHLMPSIYGLIANHMDVICEPEDGSLYARNGSCAKATVREP